MDDGGILPDALAKACRTHRPKAVYLIPTLHNPTTATIVRRTAQRDRRDHQRCRYDPDRGRCLRAARPHRHRRSPTSFRSGPISRPRCRNASRRRCASPICVTPDSAAQQDMRAALQATVQMPAPLMVALVTHWLETGIANRIITAIRNEAVGRQQLAQRALKGFQFAGQARRPSSLAAAAGAAVPTSPRICLRNGLAVVGGDAFTVDGTPPHAARVSLGAARNQIGIDGSAAHPGRRAAQARRHQADRLGLLWCWRRWRGRTTGVRPDG